MNDPRDKFRMVGPGHAEGEGVYCKDCGIKVIGAAEISVVHLDGHGRLLGLPFDCLRHSCRKPAS